MDTIEKLTVRQILLPSSVGFFVDFDYDQICLHIEHVTGANSAWQAHFLQSCALSLHQKKIFFLQKSKLTLGMTFFYLDFVSMIKLFF